MDMFCIEGGLPLRGSIRVDGSKNAALPILAATLAVTGRVQLGQIPRLQDVVTMTRLLQSMGASVGREPDGWLLVDTSAVHTTVAPYELVRQMRASVCVLGPLLSRFGKAKVSLPGGCNIGHRPIDIHLRGLAALGSDIRIEGGYVIAEASELRGADIDLSGVNGPTVTGTCNVLVAATRARGQTIIRNAACEPEVEDLGRFLCACGAIIEGLGTSTIEVTGVESLSAVPYSVIPDRIEAATFAIAAAMTGGDVTIQNAPVEHMTAVLQILARIGVQMEVAADGCSLRVLGGGLYRPVDFVTEPYPGLPTDTQAQLMALLSLVPGESRITDHIFPERFMHAAELVRMGADITVRGSSAIVRGVANLSAAPVMASDLRASAALVLAALAAEGVSEIRRVYHLRRGYREFEVKLNSLGARIRRADDEKRATRVPPSHVDWKVSNFTSEHSDDFEDDGDSRR
jgi:UDP-N-acetylglucosamine 1-carboxyvinyltransferase